MQVAGPLQQALKTAELRPSERVYLGRLFSRVQQHFSAGMQVLDAGCGDGRPAEVLARMGCRVTGVDLEGYPERWGRLKAIGAECLQASAEDLPFASGQFDAVWVKDAFHHMERPERALAELQRVTRAGGPIVVVEANRYNPVFYLHLTLFGQHQHFSRRRFRELLSRADPEYSLTLAESRCLPWDSPWVLELFSRVSDFTEAVKMFNPWLTYQIGIVRGKGR